MMFFAGGLVLVGMAAGWIGYPVGGWPGAAVAACTALAVVTVVGRRLSRDGTPGPAVTPAPLSVVRAGGYVTYDELDARLRAALRDGRSYASVLAPALRQLVDDVAIHRRGRRMTDAQLAAALGPAAWRLISVRPGDRDRDEMLTEADITTVLAAVERL